MKGKLKTSYCLSNFLLLRCRNRTPIKRVVRFVMTSYFSLNAMPATSNCNSTVAIGASNCRLATIFWNAVGGPSFKFVCEANNRILHKTASGMVRLTKHPNL